MIEGCRSWRESGLSPPDAVMAATAMYLGEEDAIGQWIDERCITGKTQWGVGVHLWESWKGWAEENKEPPGTRKGLAEAMSAHGYSPDKSRGVRGFSGIDVKAGECGSWTDWTNPHP
jgi:phage/plasmid-associated DNA primase